MYQTIINKQGKSISIAQHVASLLQSASKGVPHVNIVSIDQYYYYTILTKVFKHVKSGNFALMTYAVYLGVSMGVVDALLASIFH